MLCLGCWEIGSLAALLRIDCGAGAEAAAPTQRGQVACGQAAAAEAESHGWIEALLKIGPTGLPHKADVGKQGRRGMLNESTCLCLVTGKMEPSLAEWEAGLPRSLRVVS